MKPGYLTSEFGALVVMIVVMILNSLLGLGISEQQIFAGFGGAGLYTGGRILGKTRKPK